MPYFETINTTCSLIVPTVLLFIMIFSINAVWMLCTCSNRNPNLNLADLMTALCHIGASMNWKPCCFPCLMNMWVYGDIYTSRASVCVWHTHTVCVREKTGQLNKIECTCCPLNFKVTFDGLCHRYEFQDSIEKPSRLPTFFLVAD